MKAGRDGQPDRSETLFDYLFGRDPKTAFERLSAGIVAVIDNVDGLLEDASILVDAKRYDRAEFLIAAAQEEMGKACILLDMCRVKLARQDVLRYLCSSFYSHVLKYVYFDLSMKDYPGISTLPEFERFFRIKAKEWWPSSPESGEPDMPNDTYFLREANLYVDVDTYSGTWVVPNLSEAKAIWFEIGYFPTPLENAREAQGRFREAHQAGLLTPEALQIFNRAMKQLTVSRSTSEEKLHDAYEQAGRGLEKHLGISSHTFAESLLHSWPMYWIRR